MNDLAGLASAQELASAVSAGMYAKDRASQGLGMTVDEIRPGYARISMKVRSDMLNGHGICHGGFIFSLADSAFAYSCNSYNLATVASGCAIEFLAPGKEGDLLVAEAIERSMSGRTGVYDVSVANQYRQHIALFRGKAYRIKGEVIQVPGNAMGDARGEA